MAGRDGCNINKARPRVEDSSGLLRHNLWTWANDKSVVEINASRSGGVDRRMTEGLFEIVSYGVLLSLILAALARASCGGDCGWTGSLG